MFSKTRTAQGFAGFLCLCNIGYSYKILQYLVVFRASYPDSMNILCADDDHKTPGNLGRTRATKAAQLVNEYLAPSEFGESRLDDATDFNDMAKHCGNEAVTSSSLRCSGVADKLAVFGVWMKGYHYEHSTDRIFTLHGNEGRMRTRIN